MKINSNGVNDELKIALVDDDEGCLEVISRALTFAGFSHQTYSNPKDALEVFKSEKTDIVVTDYSMPGMSGIDVLKAVRASNPNTYVILLTGYADKSFAIEALNLGAYAFFCKPIKLKEFVEAISKIESELSNTRESNRKILMFDETSHELNVTYQELQNHVVVLNQMLDISSKIHAAIDIQKIMRELISNAIHLLDCEFCLIGFHDEQLNRYRFYSSKEQLNAQLPDASIGEFDNEVVKTFKNKGILQETNPTHEEKKIMKQYGIDLNNRLSVPLMQKNSWLGFLAAFNKNSGESFDKKDRFIIRAMCSTAVTSILNSNHIEDLKELNRKSIEVLSNAVEAR